MSQTIPTTIPPELHYEHQKVIHICDLMRSVNLTPKKIMKALLTHKNMAVKTRRAIWGSNDSWDSTDLEIVNNIRGLVCDHLEGKENCKDYILDQAKFYVALDGSQHTNEKESLGLMQRRVEARLSRDQHVLATGAPFLYELIKSKVTRSDLDGIEEDNTKDLQSLVDLEGDTLLYDFSEGRGTRADRRAHSHFRAVVKSQIAHVLFSCMAKVKDTESVPSHPPPIDPIRPHIPDMTMLKFVIASDNSSEGIGEVLQGINNQTNKTNLEAYYGRTYCNLKSLRALRRPTIHQDESVANVFMLLGASHILWDIAQAIFLLHYGDSFNSEDLGAWHTLDLLGCSADHPVTKKDFNLMISNMQWVHELRQDMAGLSGQEYIQQSHKCRLTTDSIDSFLQMAAQYDPFCKFDKVYSFVPAAITNIYKKGMKYIKENSKSTNIDKINRFNPAYTLSYVTFQIDDPGSDEEQELTTRTKNLN
ncbi:hypothetical protein MJO28_009142 [Puccinia striiformis f. sp. tritici]|uniref:Uncharacterized protein n=1 Tax=Puccinia striiformis f. sp. tritici TaxID=168172 RepID=A0ACC0E6E7_9BASI|nr:hypothetical protein MJO28_009142 [Puccinia striiformis f. sp. tritici]